MLPWKCWFGRPTISTISNLTHIFEIIAFHLVSITWCSEYRESWSAPGLPLRFSSSPPPPPHADEGRTIALFLALKILKTVQFVKYLWRAKGQSANCCGVFLCRPNNDEWVDVKWKEPLFWAIFKRPALRQVGRVRSWCWRASFWLDTFGLILE